MTKYSMIFPLLLLPIQIYGLSCASNLIIVSGKCVKSNVGNQACSMTSECADSVNGYCAGFCICNPGTIWSWYYQACLIPIGGTYCNSLLDCSDQSPSTAECTSGGVCLCLAGFNYDNINGKCGIPNNGGPQTCVSVSDCQDERKGNCNILSRCVCQPGRYWDTSIHLCKAENYDSIMCFQNSDCLIQNPKGECDGHCKCKEPYKYHITRHDCLLVNDGTHSCSSLDECYDNSDRARCSTYCICNLGYSYSTTTFKCLSPNDGVNSCSSTNDCIDQIPGIGYCNTTSFLCVCCEKCVWDNSLNFCLIPNDGILNSPSLSHCIDQTPGKTAHTGKCKCMFPSVWAPNFKRCLLPNNNTGTCVFPSDCVDQSSNGDCNSGLCVCNSFTEWIPDLLKCGCTAGKYGSGGSIDCLPCPMGTYQSLPGKSICIDCPATTFGNITGQTSESECYPCKPGTASLISGVCVSCPQCSPGFYSANYGQSTCDVCLKGTYQFNYGSSYCITCPKGTYQDTIGAINCIGCLPGTYNPTPQAQSMANCLPCPPGYYSPSLGTADCLACPMGKANENYGKASCPPCPSGSFSASTASLTCTSCPSGSTSTLGSSQCVCGAGTYFDPIQIACVPCHNFCLNCYGPSTNCSECVNTIEIVQNGNSCECAEGYKMNFNTYNSLYECTMCFSLCKTCSGPTNGECLECNSSIPHVAEIDEGYCKCQIQYFLDTSQTQINDLCQPCEKYCAHCEITPSNCTACLNIPGVQLQENTCSCSLNGFVAIINSSTGIEECAPCHPLCQTCFGLLESECFSCVSSNNVEFTFPNDCHCISSHFFNGKSCEKCHNMCESCTGPSFHDCKNCTEGVSFSVEGINGLCLPDCEALAGYYLNVSGKCTQCHSDCSKCIGNSQNDCLVCSNSSLVVFQGSCQNECPEHYYEDQRVCFECHSSCNNCSDGSSLGCVSCPNNYVYYKNMCLDKCPNNTYKQNNQCFLCEFPCQTCISSTFCLTCFPPYLLNNGVCISSILCPPSTYPNIDLFQCSNCHLTCLTCSGPSLYDCLSCNATLGLVLEESGRCIQNQCLNGYYSFIDGICKPCLKNCRSCDGINSCLICEEGFLQIMEQDNIHVSCMSCSEYHSGFYTDSDGNCREICGDGQNLGFYECDDGNLVNGDGCSSECIKEKGFACNSQITGPDICGDSTAPTGNLQVLRENQLRVRFSERVRLIGNLSELRESMSVQLIGAKCKIEFDLDPNQKKDKILYLYIHTNIPCSISGKKEYFTLTFHNSELIKDLSNNPISTTFLKAKALKTNYITDAEKKSVENMGNTFSATQLFTLFLGMAIILFQSVAINSFWAFVNMLQMISYLPIINCVLPINLQLFLTDYLTIKKIVFPFSLFSSIFPIDFLTYFTKFLTQPFNEQFELCGYESLSFLYNFSEELMTWILLLMFYVILRLLCKLFPQPTKCSFLHKWKQEYEYNGILRILLECFLNMTFCALVNIFLSNGYTLPMIVSLMGACLALYLCVGFFIFSFWLTEMPISELENPDFKEKYGTIVEDLNINCAMGKLFYPIFLFRRLVYAVALITLIDYPIVTLLFCIFVIFLPLFLLIIWCRPFSNLLHNYLNIYNEGVLLVVFVLVFVSNLFQFTENQLFYEGWVCIILLCVSLLLTWIFLIPEGIKEIYKLCKGKSLENSNDKVITEINLVEAKPINRNPLSKKKKLKSKRKKKIVQVVN